MWRDVEHCGEMRNDVLDTELKTRVPKQVKKKLREIAVSRHLKVSDILREAFREKIDRETKSPKVKAPAT
jgi:predicted transcriptional regulator